MKEKPDPQHLKPKSKRLRHILKELENYPKEEIKAFSEAAIDVAKKVDEQVEIREVDIASKFNGEEGLVSELIYKTRKKSEKEIWIHTQLIFCSINKCSKCPHGPYNFEYRNNVNGETVVKWIGTPFFNPRSILAGVVSQWPERFNPVTKTLNFGERPEG
jgi:hypothetical protein